MASFLFNRLFEAKKTGGKRIQDLQNKHADSFTPKEREVRLPSEAAPSNEGPQVFASRLAASVFKSGRMGKISIPRKGATPSSTVTKNGKKETIPGFAGTPDWQPGSVTVGGESSSGTIEKLIIPNVSEYLDKVVPEHLKKAVGEIRKQFIGHLNGLVLNSVAPESTKKGDRSGKRKISRLNASNFVISTPSDDDLKVLKALSGTRFKVPSSNDTLVSFLQQVTDKVMAGLVAAGIDPAKMQQEQGLAEFNALRQTVLQGKPANIKFASLTKKSKADTDEEKKKLQKELKYEQRAILAYAALVFPFLPEQVVKNIIESTGQFFPSVGQKYEGVALTSPLDLSDQTDFASFSLVANPTLKNVLQQVRTELLGNPEFKTLADSVAHLLVEAVRADSILPLIARKRIAKNILYSFLASASPKILNLAEIDNNKFMTSAYDPSNSSINDKVAFISPASLSLIAQAVQEAEQAPEILSNLHGQNARQALAKAITRGREAAESLRGPDVRDKKSGESLSIDELLDLGLKQPEVQKVQTAFLKWLNSDDYNVTASADLVKEITQMVSDNKTSFEQVKKKHEENPASLTKADLELLRRGPKYDYAYSTLDALLDNLHALTKDDYDLLKYIKKQLENFSAGISLAPEIDSEGKEVPNTKTQNSEDIRNEYALVFKKFEHRLQELFKINPTRHSAMQTIMGMSSLDAALVNANRQLAAYRRNESSVKRTAAKKAAMAQGVISSVQTLLDTVNLEELFSADELASNLESKIKKYVYYLSPSKLETPIQIDTISISSASTEEEIADAILELIRSKKAKGTIVKMLRNIKIPATHELSASDAKEALIHQVENPVIELGTSVSKFVMSASDTKETLLRNIVKYIKTESIEDVSRLIYSLARLPINTTPKLASTEEPSTEPKTSGKLLPAAQSDDDITVARQDALEQIAGVLDSYSPLQQSILKETDKLANSRNRRQAALARIGTLRNAPYVLSEFLSNILHKLQAAPAEVQLALKGLPTDNSAAVSAYVTELLGELVNERDLLSLLNIPANTKDFAIGSTAAAISSLAERGKAYENVELNPVKSFDSELSPAVSLLINLAAAIKTYNGIRLNPEGIPVFDLTFDSAIAHTGFLHMLDTLSSEQSVSANIATSPATKLCVQRYFLDRIATILSGVSTSLNASSFVPETFKDDFPTLVSDVDNFITSIKGGSDEVKTLVSELDERIISLIGGSALPILTKDKNNKVILNPNEKSINVPDDSTSAGYADAIRQIAFASLVGIGTASATKETNVVGRQASKVATFASVLSTLTSTNERSVRKFTNALNLIQNLIVLELGKKYANVDDITNKAVTFIASSGLSEEDAEKVIKGVASISHLTGSFDAKLHTKYELDKYANARERTNPLINGILGLFSFDNISDDSNREYEDFARNSFSKENRRDYTALHRKETGVQSFTGRQLADRLGIAYIDTIENGEVSTVGLKESVEGEIPEENPIKDNIEAASQVLGVELPTQSLFTQSGDMLAVNPKVALNFKSASRRFHGYYIGQTVRDKDEHARGRAVKPYAEYISSSQRASSQVINTYKLLYSPALFPKQYNSLSLFFSNLPANLRSLKKAVAIIASTNDSDELRISTIEGQTELFTELKTLKPVGDEWTAPVLSKEETATKSAKELKALATKPLNPIEKVMSLSTSPEAIEQEFDNIENRVVYEGLKAIIPIASGQVSWQEVTSAYAKLSLDDKKAAALAEFQEYPAAADTVAPLATTNAEPLSPAPAKVSRKFLHLYFSDFQQQVVSMVNWIRSSREAGKLNPLVKSTAGEASTGWDPTKNKKLVEIYATLFCSTTARVWPEVAQSITSLSTSLAAVLSRDEQLEIEAAIKAKPVTNLLVSAIYGRDLTSSNSHKGYIKELQTKVGGFYTEIDILKSKLATDTEKATITRHKNMINALNVKISETNEEISNMMQETMVSNADNPNNIIAKYVPPPPPKVPKTVKETVDLAMELLSLEEAVRINPAAKDIALKIFGLLYRSENFKPPMATSKFLVEKEAYPFSDFTALVAPFLYLVPLQISSEATSISQFKSIFKVKDTLLFLTKEGKNIHCGLTDFTKLAKTASLFTPITPEPTKETKEDVK